jgi:polyphosphate kinase
VLFPIEDPAMLAYLRDDVLGVAWRDTAQARILLPNGLYGCILPPAGEPLFDSQLAFLRRHSQSQ